jgi:hypothetical protein
MVIVLLRDMRRSNAQYLVASVRKVKCTGLGYETRLRRLHTLDPSH